MSYTIKIQIAKTMTVWGFKSDEDDKGELIIVVVRATRESRGLIQLMGSGPCTLIRDENCQWK